jgi:Tfp pilus assembly protein PilO
MSEHLYLLTIVLPLLTVLLIFALKYISAAYQARERSQSESAYRELAKTASSAQAETAASLCAMRTELAQISARLATVSKILQEVE